MAPRITYCACGAEKVRAAKTCRACFMEARRASDRARSQDPARKAAKLEANRRWARKDPEKTRRIYAEHGLRSKYGISLAQRDAMLRSQGDRCACCGSSDPRGRLGWNVDHDHNTGRIRGILCNVCNRTLGMIGDDLLPMRVTYARFEKYLAGPLVGIGEGCLT